MKTIDMADATAPLAEYAKSVKKQPVIVTTRGKPIAALMEIKNADLETVTLSTSPEFLAIIERSKARARKEGTISLDEIRKQLAPAKPRRAMKK